MTAERTDECFLVHFFAESVTVNGVQKIFRLFVDRYVSPAIAETSGGLGVTLYLFVEDVPNYRAYELPHFEPEPRKLGYVIQVLVMCRLELPCFVDIFESGYGRIVEEFGKLLKYRFLTTGHIALRGFYKSLILSCPTM